MVDFPPLFPAIISIQVIFCQSLTAFAQRATTLFTVSFGYVQVTNSNNLIIYMGNPIDDRPPPPEKIGVTFFFFF